MASDREKIVGLKKLRGGGEMSATTAKPKYSCENCNCTRFNPCTCMKKSK